MKKYKCFTIAELVVGMLLTSLVAGLAYYSFFLFRQQFMQLGQGIAGKNEYLLLRKALLHDVDQAIAIRDSSEHYLTMHTPAHRITYTFTENAVVRSRDAFIDSFDIQVQRMEVLHIGNMVKDLTLHLRAGKYKHTLFVSKMYSSQQLMNE